MENFKIKEEIDKNGNVECYLVILQMEGYKEKRRFDTKDKLTDFLTKMMRDKSNDSDMDLEKM